MTANEQASEWVHKLASHGCTMSQVELREMFVTGIERASSEDSRRLDWLYQATGGEWDRLNDKRFMIAGNYFRVAIDAAIAQKGNP